RQKPEFAFAKFARALVERLDPAPLLIDDARVVGDEQARRVRRPREQCTRGEGESHRSVNYPVIMADNRAGRLLADLLSDAAQPAILWQLSAFAICFVIARWA